MVNSMTVAKSIVEALEELGVKYTFGMPGSQNVELFDCLLDTGIKNILVTNELFAAFMANGYGRATGRPAVCFSIAGPGLTNMLTGIAEASVDSVPMVVIATAVKNIDKVFQIHEIEQSAVVAPLVKELITINEKDSIQDAVIRAFSISQCGEPGPVVIEIPEDILKKPALPCECDTEISNNCNVCDLNDSVFDKIVNLIETSAQVGIYAGQGAFGAHEEVIELAELLSAPVTTTVSGKGVIPEDHPLAVGFGFGPCGLKVAEDVFKECDTLMAIGCKFSEMATGNWGCVMPENVIHIDISEKVLDKNVNSVISVRCDAKKAVGKILDSMKQKKREKKNDGILEKIKAGRESKICAEPVSGTAGVSPAFLVGQLRKHMDREALLVTDCGYHQLWTITDYPVYMPRTFISPTDYQAMGYGIPAAIGAKLAYPDRDVVCICGDGGFLISGFEVLTAVRENINIVIIIFNDSGLGIIRDIQNKKFGRTNSVEFNNPDFAVLAKSFSAEYVSIKADEGVERGLAEAFKKNKPVIVDVFVDYNNEPKYYNGLRKVFWNRLSADEKMEISAKLLERTRKNAV
ncbi:MAG: thiamine pyrophosphate-binding protein [Elusimicrobiota bacterium]